MQAEAACSCFGDDGAERMAPYLDGVVLHRRRCSRSPPDKFGPAISSSRDGAPGLYSGGPHDRTPLVPPTWMVSPGVTRGRRSEGGDRQQPARLRRALLPVGPVADAALLLARVLPDRQAALTPPPRWAMLRAPLSYYFLRAGVENLVPRRSPGAFAERQYGCRWPRHRASELRRARSSGSLRSRAPGGARSR